MILVLKWRGEHDYFQIGRVLMNVFIAFLAHNKDLQTFIEFGALFQALVESFMKVQVCDYH